MRAKCDSCGEVKRVNKTTGICLACRNKFREVVDEFFDGDALAPLKYALAERGAVRDG